MYEWGGDGIGKNRQLVSQAEKLPLNVSLLAFSSLGQSGVAIGGRRTRHQVLRLCPLLLCIYSFRIVFIVLISFFLFWTIVIYLLEKNCFTPLWVKCEIIFNIYQSFGIIFLHFVSSFIYNHIYIYHICFDLNSTYVIYFKISSFTVDSQLQKFGFAN